MNLRIFLMLNACFFLVQCKAQPRKAFVYGYNGCENAAAQQAEYLRRGEKDKFRYMMLDKQTFIQVVFPRLRGYKGTNATDVWELTAFEIERSTERAFDELKGATAIEVGPPAKIEQHEGMRLFRNFSLAITSGKTAKDEPIVQENDKILSALVEIDGICRHWVNAYKD